MISSISPSQHAKTFTKLAFGATPMCGVPVLSPAPVPAAIPATCVPWVPLSIDSPGRQGEQITASWTAS